MGGKDAKDASGNLPLWRCLTGGFREGFRAYRLCDVNIVIRFHECTAIRHASSPASGPRSKHPRRNPKQLPQPPRLFQANCPPAIHRFAHMAALPEYRSGPPQSCRSAPSENVAARPENCRRKAWNSGGHTPQPESPANASAWPSSGTPDRPLPMSAPSFAPTCRYCPLVAIACGKISLKSCS